MLQANASRLPADANLKKPEEARNSTVESQGWTAIPKISFHRNKALNRNQAFSRTRTICLQVNVLACRSSTGQ